jgi:hypothetical protein
MLIRGISAMIPRFIIPSVSEESAVPHATHS